MLWGTKPKKLVNLISTLAADFSFRPTDGIAGNCSAVTVPCATSKRAPSVKLIDLAFDK